MIRRVIFPLGLVCFVSITGCARIEDGPLFDKSYESYCGLYNDIVDFSLKHHVYWTPDDREHTSKAAVKKFQLDLGTQVDVQDDTCEMIEAIFANQTKTNLGQKDFYRGLISTYMDVLDPHSRYLTPEAVKKDQEATESKKKTSAVEYYYRNSKIGAYSKQNPLWVDYLHEDAYPGLKPGMKVRSIEGQNILQKTMREIQKFIDPDQKIYKLGVSGMELSIDRFAKAFPSFYVKTVLVEGETVAWVRLKAFTRGVASQIKAYLDANDDIQAIVIDLRGNGGGLLAEAHELLDYFLPPKQVYKRINYRGSNLNQYKLSEPQQNDKPMIVFVDSGSASASEIFAGVIAIEGRGSLIGNRSFGKMTSQTPFPISDKNGIGGKVYITRSVLLFSDDTTAQWHGLQPHIFFKDPQVDILDALDIPVFESQLEAVIKPNQDKPGWSLEEATKELSPCPLENLRDCTHEKVASAALDTLIGD